MTNSSCRQRARFLVGAVAIRLHDVARRDLCSQSTISRPENLPDRRALLSAIRRWAPQYWSTRARLRR
jgi:hypothetical protein